MKAFLSVVLLLAVLLIAILLGAQNDQIISVNYLIAQTELRLSVLMAIMLVIGIGLSWIIFSLVWAKMKWRIRQLERKHQTHTSTELK